MSAAAVPSVNGGSNDGSGSVVKPVNSQRLNSESNLPTALDLIDRGIPCFPCVDAPEDPKRDKRPITKNGHLDASLNPEQIGKWFGTGRKCLIGVPTGSRSCLDVLDLDPRHGSLPWRESNLDIVASTRVHRTRSGGEHLLFKHNSRVRNSQGKIAPGLDVRGEGGFIVWWPAHVDQVSGFDRAQIADWPEHLLNAAVARKMRPAAVDAVRDDVTGAALLAAGVAEILNAATGTLYEVCKTVTWRLAGYVNAGRLDEQEARDATIAAAEAAGGQDMQKVKRLWDGALEKVGPTIEPGSEFDALPPEPNPQWKSMLLCGAVRKDGTYPIIGNELNAMLALRLSPAWCGILAFDEFAQSVRLRRAPPWQSSIFVERELQDSDGIDAAAWLQAEGIPIGREMAYAALLGVAGKARFDRLADFYRSMKWDGVSRVAGFLIDHCGAVDMPLHRAYSERFLVSLAARALRPGCKVDTMLVLEGPQSLGKSTLCKALSPWTTDNMPDLKNKDAAVQLLGIHIAEFAEIDKLKGAAVSTAKAFISTATDRFRPPYGKSAADFPRRCVFIGTVNPDGAGYLRDNTGNRRYWPVACGVGWKPGRRINAEAVAEVRDQLLAEAVVLLDAGRPWWLETPELEATQNASAAERFDPDVWGERVAEYLANRTEVSMTEILVEALCKPLDRCTQSDKSRVGSLLKELGWTRRQLTGGRRMYFRDVSNLVVLKPKLDLPDLMG